MGYMRHHAIIVTSWDNDRIVLARAAALGLGLSVTSITEEVTNGYRTFLVGPDGSKEGWDASNVGDAQRAEFIGWLNRHRAEDGSSAYDWAVVQYGDDDGDNRLLLSDADPPSLKSPCDLCGAVEPHAWSALGRHAFSHFGQATTSTPGSNGISRPVMPHTVL